MTLRLDASACLPEDRTAGTLVGRAWITGAVSGPSPIVIRADGVYDISTVLPTSADVMETDDPIAAVRIATGVRIGSLEELLANTACDVRSASRSHLLPPVDLQVIKAGGVTFMSSLMERVIEEQAHGDAARAEAIRGELSAQIGADLSHVKPGSGAAMQLKEALIERGLWSQYLEVGIGPDAEVFTKAPVLSAVGTGAEVGIHPRSSWNNPEPEAVLISNSRGKIVGAALGNDVNLRDIEGRSALLLGKAKDNNASCAIGPFIRLFDETFTLDDVRAADIALEVVGEDGFTLRGASSMREISRDPEDLVAQTLGPHHQYPDGLALFTGTMFAPIEDRETPGQGFTHKLGDVVTISSPKLGTLVNRVTYSDRAAPWTFGVRDFMRNLAARGLLH